MEEIGHHHHTIPIAAPSKGCHARSRGQVARPREAAGTLLRSDTCSALCTAHRIWPLSKTRTQPPSPLGFPPWHHMGICQRFQRRTSTRLSAWVETALATLQCKRGMRCCTGGSSSLWCPNTPVLGTAAVVCADNQSADKIISRRPI